MGTAVTKQTIEAAWRKRPERGPMIIKIPQVAGMDLRLAPDGATWRLDYRLPGVNPETGKRWPGGPRRLGELRADFHLHEAVALARAWRVKIDQGIDPYLERKVDVAVQLAETAAAVRTVQSLVDAYRATRSPRWRPATLKAFEGDLRTITAALGSLPVHKVTRKVLASFLRDFVDEQVAEGRRGTRVERLRMLLGSLFLFAVERDWIEMSPAQRLPLPAQSTARSRTLSAPEILTAWRALSEPQLGIGEGLRLLLKLSLATGQLIGAVALAREPDLDLDGQDDPDLADAGPRWTIRGVPGAKAEHDRVLPLSPLTVELFREALALPGRDVGGHVFRGKKAAAALTQASISRAWAKLRKAGRVPAGTTPHDLRRTARTWWPDLAHGQEERVLERILGHAVGTKVSRVYDRALWLPQQRAVLNAWGRKLATIATGGAKVVELARDTAHA